jgi:hypothetical protein
MHTIFQELALFHLRVIELFLIILIKVNGFQDQAENKKMKPPEYKGVLVTEARDLLFTLFNL